MPIPFQSAADLGNNGTTTNNLSVSFTVSTNQNRCLLAIIGTQGQVIGDFTVTYNGVPMTYCPNSYDSTNWDKAVFVLTMPATGSNSLVLTYTGGGNTYLDLVAFEYDGVLSTGEPDNSGTAADSTNEASFSSNFSTIGNNCTVVAFAINYGAAGVTPSCAAPYTARAFNTPGEGILLADYGPVSPAGSTTFTATIGDGSEAGAEQSQFFVSLIPAPTQLTCDSALLLEPRVTDITGVGQRTIWWRTS